MVGSVALGLDGENRKAARGFQLEKRKLFLLFSIVYLYSFKCFTELVTVLMEPIPRMNFIFSALILGFLLGGCTAEKKSPEIEALTQQLQKALETQKDLEAQIQKTADSDPGKAGFLTHDLELLQSRILAIKARGKALNAGEDLFPESTSPAGGSGH